MLIGLYEHSVDQKGRFNFPFKLREQLGETFIIAQGFDGCLFAFSKEEWQKLADKIDSLPLTKTRRLQRILFAGASEAEPDKQGRVLLPANLRKHAGIEKEIVVIGVSNRVEIWSAERYNNPDDLNPDEPDPIYAAMEELGL